MIEKILQKEMDEWRQCDGKLVIWGDLLTAKKIGDFLDKNNIFFSGYVVNRLYIKKNESINPTVGGKPLYCLEDYVMEHSCSIIVGFAGYKSNLLNVDADKSRVRKIYAHDFLGMLAIGEDNTIDDEFISVYGRELSEFRELLEDQTSKEHLDIFIDQKRTGIYEKPFSNNIQYFDSDIIQVYDNEIFIDCGAYDGKTTIEFLNIMDNNQTKYKKIFAIEASKENAIHVQHNLKAYKQITVLNVAVSDKNEILRMQMDLECASKISDDGTTIEARTIDSISGDEKITFIKMDVEGSELRALQGAVNTIKLQKPKLAICIYHKPEDLITIPQFIYSINPEYKFYFRNYSASGTESVLYAI